MSQHKIMTAIFAFVRHLRVSAQKNLKTASKCISSPRCTSVGLMFTQWHRRQVCWLNVMFYSLVDLVAKVWWLGVKWCHMTNTALVDDKPCIRMTLQNYVNPHTDRLTRSFRQNTSLRHE